MSIDLQSYGARLFHRRDSGRIVQPAKVSIGDWQPTENRCHENVTVLCSNSDEYQPVRGWLYFHFEHLLSFVRFTAHSVIRTRDGSLYDVTPSRASQPYPFILAEEAEDQYAALIDGAGVQHLDYEVATALTTPHGLTSA